jgi:dolichyl-phosphate beta-glucosyltransferase
MNETPKGQEIIADWMEKQAVASEAIELSVIIPAFNEERRLPPTLIDIVDFCDRHHPRYEIIVVDDGSTDATSEVVRKFERVRPQVRLIHLPRNLGKGHAVRLGVLNSRGNRVLFADADGATPIAETDRLMAAISAGAEVAIGSRAKYSEETKVNTVIYRRILGRIFNWCVNFILLPGIADTQCGFKMFTRPAAHFLFKLQRSDRFSFDVELLFLARRVGLRIDEIPINWQNVPGSKVNLVFDSIKMFRDIFRFRVVHRAVGPEQYQRALTDLSVAAE